MSTPTELLTEKSRAVALDFCKHVNARRFDLVADMFADNAGWWVVANTSRADWGGTVNGKLRAQWAGELLASFEEWS